MSKIDLFKAESRITLEHFIIGTAFMNCFNTLEKDRFYDENLEGRIGKDAYVNMMVNKRREPFIAFNYIDGADVISDVESRYKKRRDLLNPLFYEFIKVCDNVVTTEYESLQQKGLPLTMKNILGL
jgi:hypothetical protein